MSSGRRIVILEPDRYPEAAEAMLGSVGTVIRRRTSEPISDLLAEAEILVVRLAHRLDRKVLEKAPKLKAIVTATTGIDHIDLEYAVERGIAVLGLKGETEFLRTVTATAEHSWGLLLGLLRRIPWAHASVLSGSWDREAFFGTELQGRTLGIVGLGRIGSMVAQYGRSFRMQVQAFDPSAEEWQEGVRRVALFRELLQTADVVSLHVPLGPETRRMMGAPEFALMKRTAVLVNTSRGAVVDESALLKALEGGQIAGAALDVITEEYAGRDPRQDPLLRYAAEHTNLLLTPHLGGATHDSLERTETFMARKLLKHLANEGRSLPS
jgi:D-3-phosphoglycerate dehydrogenase